MARVKSLVRGLASSYALLGASVVYGLISVPLALHYLSNEEFGLWSMVMQFVTYLAMVDLGMSGSVGRLLIDYKDDGGTGRYESLVVTGSFVLACQGVIMLLLGYYLAPWFANISRLPEPLAASFVTLMRAQCLIAALGFPVRIFTHVLYAHQRLDIVNVGQILFFVGGITFMWLGFKLGAGVYSILWSSVFGLLQTATFTYIAARRLGLLRKSRLSSIRLSQAAEMFRYGRDVFLVALGTQMVATSQPIILSRNFGLDAVATWTVGTRMFGLVNQLVWKIADIAAPGFAEMIVRGERVQLEYRYRQVAIVSASLAGWAAVTLWQTNSTFVSLWTGNAISWFSVNDFFLACWMVCLSLVHCHNGFMLITKQIEGMRWIYFLEGLSFLLVALLLSSRVSDGIGFLLKTSLVCSLCFSGVYGVWRISRYFSLPLFEVAGLWLVPTFCVVGVYGSASVLLYNFLLSETLLFRLIAHLLFAGTVGMLIFIRLGVPKELRDEGFRRIRGIFPVSQTGTMR